MKKFSKELFLQVVESEKEKGIITQQDIDNALVVWVNDAEGKTKQELKNMSIKIESLKEDWIEGELEEEEEKEEETVPIEEETVPIIENESLREEYKDEYFEEIESVDSDLEIIEEIPVEEIPLEEVLDSEKVIEKLILGELKEEVTIIEESVRIEENVIEEEIITKESPLIEEEIIAKEVIKEEIEITEDNTLIKEEDIEN